MSDTSPKNQDALTSGHTRPISSRVERHGKEIWRLAKDGEILSCELLDDSHVGAGWEVVLRKNDEVIVGHRCTTRTAADQAAHIFAQDYRRTGWTEIPLPSLMPIAAQ